MGAISSHVGVRGTDVQRVMVGAFGGAFAGLLVSMSLTLGWSTHLSSSGSWAFFFWDDHGLLRVFGSFIAALAGGTLAGTHAGVKGIWVGIASSFPAFLVWVGVTVGLHTGVWFFTDWTIEVPSGAEFMSLGALLVVLPAGALGGAWGERIHGRTARGFSSGLGFLGIPRRHLIWLPAWTLLFLIQVAWASVIVWQAFLFAWSGGVQGFPAIVLCALSFLFLWSAMRGVIGALRSTHHTHGKTAKVMALLKYGLGFPFSAWILQVAALILLAWS